MLMNNLKIDNSLRTSAPPLPTPTPQAQGVFNGVGGGGQRPMDPKMVFKNTGWYELYKGRDTQYICLTFAGDCTAT
jgi:hypothetical protein